MLNSRRNSNDLIESGGSPESFLSSRNHVNEQNKPGCYPKTAGMKGSGEGNKIVMQCYFKSKTNSENDVPIRRYI